MNRSGESPILFLFFLFGICLLVWALSGCVSIATHERAKQNRYVDGQRDAYSRVLYYSQTKNLDDTRWLIKSALDVLGPAEKKK